MEPYIELIKSLKLEKRLLPSNNPEISWFYIFLPALVAYFALLSNYINEKPIGGHLEAIQGDKFWKIFPRNAAVEIIYRDNSSIVDSWYEGPLWVDNDTGGYLLFSNTISNKIYRWEEGKGLFSVGRTIYSDFSGCYSNVTHCEAIKEPGSNGLLQVPVAYRSPKFPDAVDIFVSQHGERAIGLLRENGTRTVIASHYRNRRLNSPNDIILTPEGHVYFTDPPYGLYHKQSNKIQYKELPFNGIYFIDSSSLFESIRSGQPANAAIKLMNKDMARPNGLAFSPDFSRVYVSNSDAKNSFWRVFHVQENGKLYACICVCVCVCMCLFTYTCI
jgi:gluconolactonase